jgi:50S ribosome-binding GTPase/Domain of unknown function (DUF3482)
VTVTLSLISHTNVGKTTLARTLLRRDVGESRDAPHVTLFNEEHNLLTVDGHILRLWDTPGFGDTSRLLKRLLKESSPLTWLVSQTWDRIMDKPLWCSQQAIKNVRDEADVVLYLVNAAEAPGAAAYVAQEMQILTWVAKPVLVLLNQVGVGRPPAEEMAEVEAWRAEMKQHKIVQGVLSLDAFARCWVQEDHLMLTLTNLLSGEKKTAMTALQNAWHAHHARLFKESMRSVAEQLTASVLDGFEVKPQSALKTALKFVAQRVGLDQADLDPELAAARQSMAKTLAERMTATTNKLIKAHGLEGLAEQRALAVTQGHFLEPAQINESIWGAVGGVAAGMMAGLWADLHAGGMTFGGGTVVGGLAGGMGAYALAKGYNLVRGEDSKVHWSRDHFREQARLGLLCYLAVAHFGRGRGEWSEAAMPIAWEEAAKVVIEHRAAAWDNVWRLAVERSGSEFEVRREMESVLQETALGLLRRLYPAARVS